MSKQPRTCDLWLSDDCVLTVAVDALLKGFEPDQSHHRVINNTIRDLARAVKPCIYAAENDTTRDTSFAIQPLEAIASAIIILTQLSTAVQDALGPVTSEVGHDC